MRRSLIACALLCVALTLTPTPRALAFLFAPRTYAGIMGENLNITLELERQGSLLQGRYMYDRVGAWLDLSGVVNRDETFTLEERDEGGTVTGRFSGQWLDNVLLGRWTNPSGTTDLPFRVEAPGQDTDPAEAGVLSFSFQGRVHPDLPEFTFRYSGAPGPYDTVDVASIEVFAPGRTAPLQVMDHLHTESALPDAADYFSQGDTLVLEDMNFDGFLDLRLKETTSVTGNTAYLFWLYDPIEARFVRRGDMEVLSSPQFDPATRTILSFGRGPGGVTTWTYVWDDGLLSQIAEEDESFSANP